jgi:hypothetical protein
MEGFDIHQAQEENSEKFQELSSIVSRMEQIGEAKDISTEQIIFESKILVKELLEHLESDLKLELSNDVTSFYNQMSRENLLARVESATSVIACVALDKPISVGSGDRHYANSVASEAEGLRIAMAEAEALGPIRFLVGLDVKALVGFKNDHLTVSEIDEQDFDLRDTSLRKAQCRHVAGEIRNEDIRYMVMRIPRKVFPQEKLLSDEVNQTGNFIFRGAQMGSVESLSKELLHKAA